MTEQINLGKWSEAALDDILIMASQIRDPRGRIEFLSEQFLGTKYKESSLIGSNSEQEVYVINLEGVDCFTFLDYIEAMRRSGSFSEFRDNLTKVRYRSGEISFANRNHFFTDWKDFNADCIVDVTAIIGAGRTKSVSKRLNDRADGTVFIPGISSRVREVVYVRTLYCDEKVINNLRTGDYIGIYSNFEGLDVSHTGIFIKKNENSFLRHASSHKKQRKIVDEDFVKYIKHKPGFIVFRARDDEPDHVLTK